MNAPRVPDPFSREITVISFAVSKLAASVLEPDVSLPAFSEQPVNTAAAAASASNMLIIFFIFKMLLSYCYVYSIGSLCKAQSIRM